MVALAARRLVARWYLQLLCSVAISCRGSTMVHVATREIVPGVHMPTISIGTGGLESADASLIVRTWLDIGGRGVDTALMYRDQPAVTQAISSAGIKRSDVFITTKIPGCIGAKAAVESDLRQLRTDYIDLLLVHFPTPGCSIAWRTLEELHAKGVLKAIGVSNFKTKDLETLLKTAKVVPAVNQIELNLLNHDDDTIKFAQAHNITIEAFSPLGRGSGDIPHNAAIRAVASKHNVTTYQVAMKLILQHGYILTFQSTSASHQADDADLNRFNLSTGEMKLLDGLQNSPAYSRREASNTITEDHTVVLV